MFGVAEAGGEVYGVWQGALMLDTMSIRIRKPLPVTQAGLEARLKELLQARESIDEEIQIILASNHPITQINRVCVRCKHTWVPRKSTVIVPKVCPKCHSRYWNRPPLYRSKRKSSLPLWEKPKPEAQAQFDPPLLPPPPTPISLRDRLKEVMQQPEENPAPEEQPSDES